MADQRRPKGPAYVYLAIAFVLLVVLAALTLSSRQPPPPSIAEFAPQAVEQITDSPDDQSSSRRAAAGAVGEGGGPGGAGAATAAPIDVPRVRRCVGDPPRQIEDPQSPPCVPYWSGDNGGATSPGVTRDEVIIANAGGRNGGVQERFQNFFNKRFEFYGRKLRILNMGGCPEGCDTQVGQHAAAVRVDEQAKAFATTEWASEGSTYFVQEIARRRIVHAASPEFSWTQQSLSDMAPYIWQYTMGVEDMLTSLGAWMCRRFAGGSADHAGGDVAGKPRVFGVLLRPAENEPGVSLEPLHRSFASCGARFAVVSEYPDYAASSRDTVADTQSATNTVQQFRVAGATTIVCLCAYYQYPKNLWQAASRQAYYPEWLVSSFGAHATTFAFNWITAVPEQAEHAMGVAFEPKELPADAEPFVWALREVDPGYNTTAEYNQHRIIGFYRSLLLLASGIQMAGPRLTPETFKAGLHRAVFPNPEHPIMAGKVGFAGSSYSMTLDGAEFWWSNSDTLEWPNPHDAGSICYVANGARYTADSWPSGPDPFFNRPCR